MGDAVIRVDGVTKRFRRFREIDPSITLKMAAIQWLRSWGRRPDRMHDPDCFDAIKDVRFDIERGETVAFIGRNGAGKSTLLKMIAGIYRPDAGRIEVNGRVAALIELGAGFHPEFTGRENVLINGIILGLSKREVAERFDAIVDFAAIREFIDAPVRTYSSGMFMRLAFSVAIHAAPEVLLVDEVLAVGDEQFQKKCLATIEQRVRARKDTTIIVSHDLEAVGRLCSKAVIFDPPRATWRDDVGGAIEEFRAIENAKGSA